MSRSLGRANLPALTLALCGAAIAAASEPQALWDEIGLVSTSQIDRGEYRLDAYRFKDSTGALAGSLAIPNAVESGNYALVCEGKCPKDLASLAPGLPGFADQSLPTLFFYLPGPGLTPQSARYLLGPVGLAEWAPEIPAEAAAFQFGAEAVLGRYGVGRETTLALFNYPTPQMARAQLDAFRKIPGSVAKRSGPLIALVLHAPDPAAANKLLAEIEYAARVNFNEIPPLVIRPQTAAQIVLGGIELAGLILVFCLLSGLAYGGIRVLRRRFGSQDADKPMIVLGLDLK